MFVGNVVCQDHISAALALLAHSREIKDEDLKMKLLEESNSHWREGFPHPKKDFIFFRFATNSDKKESKFKSEKNVQLRFNNDIVNEASDKNPWGDLCKSWGIRDHQEVLNRPYHYESDEEAVSEKVVEISNKDLAKRLGKRRHNIHESEDSNSDTKWKRKCKTPRMRMHADDEQLMENKKTQTLKQLHLSEKEYRNKDPVTLSIEIMNEDSIYTKRSTTKLSDKFKVIKGSNSKDNVKSRLGVKLYEPNQSECSDDSSDNSIEFRNSRVHKVRSLVENRVPNVWSRLDIDKQRHDKQSQSDLRHKLKSKKHDPDDLRYKIDSGSSARKDRHPLRIEVDNEYYSYSD